MKDIRELLQTRPLLFDGAMGTYYKAAPGVECEQANLTDPAGVLAVHREYLAAGLMPSRRIPSACPGWRRHTRPAGNSWRRQAGSWLCRPQRRRVPPFCRPRPGSGYRGGSGGAGIYGCGKAVHGAGGQEFPVRDPELRCGPSGCRGDHQAEVPDACAGVFAWSCPTATPGRACTAKTLPGGCRKAASWMLWA